MTHEDDAAADARGDVMTTIRVIRLLSLLDGNVIKLGNA
jgi:hypothetical protein